uniref:Ig-like domain-containing protein n=1 Tax=Anopheles melas TaxID=34690 RepID=A0A182TXF2_9DIPT
MPSDWNGSTGKLPKQTINLQRTTRPSSNGGGKRRRRLLGKQPGDTFVPKITSFIGAFRLDQVVQHNSKSGVIMSSTALALQTVTRHQAGNYTCIASNVEGDGESNTVDLKVMCKCSYVENTFDCSQS